MLNFRLAEAGVIIMVVAAQDKRLCGKSQNRDGNMIFGREDKVQRLLYSAVVLNKETLDITRICLQVRVERLS